MADLRHEVASSMFPAPTKRPAPVVTMRKIEIEAAPEVVWKVITGFDRWPNWNPEVKSLIVDGPPAVGTTFRWRAGPGTITSTIQRIEAPRVIAWTGNSLGIKAVDFWRLVPHEGKTLVREEEAWEGLVARLFRTPLQKTLDRSLENGLRYLKAAAERTASFRSGPGDG